MTGSIEFTVDGIVSLTAYNGNTWMDWLNCKDNFKQFPEMDSENPYLSGVNAVIDSFQKMFAWDYDVRRRICLSKLRKPRIGSFKGTGWDMG